MTERDEVLLEFGRKYCVDSAGTRVEWIDKPWRWSRITENMADEIVRLRAQLTTATAERDQLASMLHDCEQERDGWKHRAEQTTVVTDAQIEAAARAIHDAHEERFGLKHKFHWDECAPHWHIMCRRQARAALTAAREVQP